MTTSTETFGGNRRMKPKPLPKKPVSKYGRRSETFAIEPEGTLPYRDGLVLLPYSEAPLTDSHFVPINPLGVPPKTFYVLNLEERRAVHMVSQDEDGTYVAWDTDRDFRYFMRARNPLVCPRSIEYIYDASVAIKAGENWGPSHPNYRGTLTGVVKVEVPEPKLVPTIRRALPAEAPTAPKKTLARKTATTGRPKLKEPERKRILRRAGVDDGGILSESGNVDHGKLRDAATDMASRATAVFGNGSKKRTLRKK